MTGATISELPPQAVMALKQFPEFQLSTINDSGANGYVLIGKHSVLKKDVAIKIYFHDENDVDQEPTIISKIDHENVLKVFDVRKVEKNCSYFLMPAASDGDLSKFLDNSHISLPLAHKLLCQLLSGISALHGAPNFLVHRDLKPENLLIHDEKIVIADFGSVRRIDQNTQKAPASKHSILYRPPEAFGSEAFFNFASDIYQAGLIGFLLFGGKLSNMLLAHMTERQKESLSGITGDYEQSIYVDSCIEQKIRAEKLVNLSELPFYVPISIKKALKKAISPIGKRYNNVSEFLVKLSRLSGNIPEWIVHEQGFLLNDWKGFDYLVRREDLAVLKRKTGSATFRINNRYSGTSFVEIHNMLKEQLGLP